MSETSGIILVEAAEVLTCDTRHVRKTLDSLIPKHMGDNRNGVVILINGYDDDPQELFLIPEVRKWFHSLFDNVPDLFFWMNMGSGRLMFYALMMGKPIRIHGGTTIRSEDMRKFLKWGFYQLNIFCKRHGIDPEPSNQHILECLKEASA
ncbi:MAG TPA: chlororespiratory reduction 6 domain-containing protein [Nevskiales bacterium]|nr:chlororespiratory reduction 6 domain-containing protein [Nevskiales bacterium]